jgi:hypothetical protein
VEQQEFSFGRERTIQDRFEEFHRNNPKVYDLIVFYSRAALKSGREHYGMASIFERIRWHMYIETRSSDDDFKLNNDFRSRYARLVMEREADLSGFFELRELRSQ